MPVRIFFPRIPTDEEDFLKFVSGWCNTYNAKIMKNKEGTPFCILPISYGDSKGKSANDIIEALTGKVVGDVTLKPRLYVDHGLRKDISDARPLKDDFDDVVNVTHYFRDFYYVQLSSERDKNKVIGEYLSTLYDECRSNMLTVLEYDEITIGRFYASKYKNENNFFRIKVLDKLEKDEIKVHFVDYGNVEYIRDQPVLEISEKIASIPPLAYKCSIDNVCIVDPKKHDLVSKEVLNRNYKTKITKTLNDEGIECMSVDFVDFASVTYRNFLILENVAVENGSANNNFGDCNVEQNTKCDNIKENGVKNIDDMVVMTHMDSLDEFYVQLANKASEADLFNVSKKIEYLTLKLRDDLQFVSDDFLYLSKFSVDGNWYRCRVISNKFNDEEASCTVQFIDFGNKEKKHDIKDLKPLTTVWCEQAAELADLTPCARRCSFSAKLASVLSSAKLGRSYFRKEFIQAEKIFNLTYREYDGGEDKQGWVVDNLRAGDDQDYLAQYGGVTDPVKEALPQADYYRLSNIEAVDKMWFQLVSTEDKTRDADLKSIRRWCVSRVPSDVKTVCGVTLDQLYCAVNKHGQLFRCKVMSKNMENACVQFIDTGIYDNVKVSQLYPLSELIASIRPIAQSFALSVQVKHGREIEVEKKICQIMDQADVRLDLVDGVRTIRDVFVKEKSLVTTLKTLGLVESSVGNRDDRYKGLPDCLLPSVIEDEETIVDVDFSLPSVDRMNDVPTKVAIENGKVHFLRKLFPMDVDGDTGGSVLDGLWSIAADCDKLDKIMELCVEVDQLSVLLTTVTTDFSAVLIERKSKTRDLVPLMERRTCLCNDICALHTTFGRLMDAMSSTVMDHLLNRIDHCLRGLSTVMAVCHIVPDQKHLSLNIKTLHTDLTHFHQSTLFHDLMSRIKDRARVTEEARLNLKAQFHSMCRPYDLVDTVPGTDNGFSVPLVDSTYEMYTALKAEHAHFMELMSCDEVTQSLDLATVLLAGHNYLHKQRASIHTILTKTASLQLLHDYASDVLRDDLELNQTIEDSHRKILSSRSALRHAVPDLEDAEELDLKDRQHELHVKIHDIRISLHNELRGSKELLDSDDVRNLMLKKSELQLKNQSILLHDHGMPIFLWDSIFFDLSQESCSDPFINSMFENERVKIKKVHLSLDHYRSVLASFSAYSSHTVTAAKDADRVPVLPISYMFLSKCGPLVLNLIVPDFVALSGLPVDVTQSLESLVSLLQSLVDQIVVLWHLGLIYGQDDLRYGPLLQLQHHNDDGDKIHLCLPLPLTAIINWDSVTDKETTSTDSINVYMRKLGTLFSQAMGECACDDGGRGQRDSVQRLIDSVTECTDVEEAEAVHQSMREILTKLSAATNGDGDHVVDGGVPVSLPMDDLEALPVPSCSSSSSDDNDGGSVSHGDGRGSSSIEQVVTENGDGHEEEEEEDGDEPSGGGVAMITVPVKVMKEEEEIVECDSVE